MRNMRNHVTGLNITTKSGMDREGCMNGNSSLQPFSSSAYGKVKTKASLEVVHSDVVGPMRVKSQGGAKNMVTFIDDYSRFIHAYFIQTKGEVFSIFTEFKALVENQFGKRIKCLRSVNGGEYINDNFAILCKNSGIIQQTTVPYSPQQNGLAERMKRTFTERARCMLSHMQVEEKWWAETMNTAVCVTNRVPCAAIKFRTPFEVCYGRKPSVVHFKVFGAQGYAHIDKSKRSKFYKSLQMFVSVLFREHQRVSCMEFGSPSSGNDAFS
uniref:Putative polyprotein n=1 Tax=Albugo laibachii Nc14 TaxID=890382 RepID=F0WIU6_9STRA|nr:putative polyprotein [Albugo laibachii Nc14]|eukprot:CCA21190.1 putative polyprotein [Albugo laibachii Nc14]